MSWYRPIPYVLVIVVAAVVAWAFKDHGEPWKSVALGVSGSCIAAVLFDLCLGLIRWLRSLGSRRKAALLFGKDMLAGECGLVYNVVGNFSVTKEGLAAENDMAAMLAVSRVIIEFSASAPKVWVDTYAEAEIDRSFVAVGSGNAMSRVLERNGGSLVVEWMAQKGDPYLRFQGRGSTDMTPYRTDLSRGEDYAVIIRVVPIQYPNRVWLVCAGITGFGTRASGVYLSKRWGDVLARFEENGTDLRRPSVAAVLLRVQIKSPDASVVVDWNARAIKPPV
jgi:hypothetical protein